MIHLPTGNGNGTSFHGTIIVAKPIELISILGKADFTNEDKVNMEWVRELDSADVFTIYDWKNYNGIELNEDVHWHIGGKNRHITEEAKDELIILLKEYREKSNSEKVTI